MSFTFHERSSWELRNTHNKNGANSEGHAITFCPLTSTGLAFDATASDGQQIELGVSGVLINSNLVLYDRRDERTLYPQMIHAAISGPQQGDKLQLLPATETTWGLWKKMYPHTTIAQAATGLERYPPYIQKLYPLEAYRRYPYGDYRSNHSFIMFPPLNCTGGMRISCQRNGLGPAPRQSRKSLPFPAHVHARHYKR
jgi:hypothetical protein